MNKKGFTLIELLAVIVILAIILLIAMPIVIGVIEEAREGAFKSSGHGLWKTAENEYAKRMIEDPGAVEDVWYVFVEGQQQEVFVDDGEGGYTGTNAPDELEFTGATPQNGIIHVANDGEVEFWLHDGTFCAYRDGQQVTASKVALATCESDAHGLNMGLSEFD